MGAGGGTAGGPSSAFLFGSDILEGFQAIPESPIDHEDESVSRDFGGPPGAGHGGHPLPMRRIGAGGPPHQHVNDSAFEEIHGLKRPKRHYTTGTADPAHYFLSDFGGGAVSSALARQQVSTWTATSGQEQFPGARVDDFGFAPFSTTSQHLPGDEEDGSQSSPGGGDNKRKRRSLAQMYDGGVPLDISNLTLETATQFQRVDNAEHLYLGLALHSAAFSGDPRAAQILLSYGGDIFLRDNYGQSCLHVAAMHGHVGMIEVLLERVVAYDADFGRDLYPGGAAGVISSCSPGVDLTALPSRLDPNQLSSLQKMLFMADHEGRTAYAISSSVICTVWE